MRLDRVGFDEGSDAFGFVDPAIVIRAAHLIPAFAHGRDRQGLRESIAQNDKAGDWSYYYVNRYANVQFCIFTIKLIKFVSLMFLRSQIPVTAIYRITSAWRSSLRCPPFPTRTTYG